MVVEKRYVDLIKKVRAKVGRAGVPPILSYGLIRNGILYVTDLDRWVKVYLASPDLDFVGAVCLNTLCNTGNLDASLPPAKNVSLEDLIGGVFIDVVDYAAGGTDDHMYFDAKLPLSRISKYCATDESRASLTCVSFGTDRIYATDGHTCISLPGTGNTFQPLIRAVDCTIIDSAIKSIGPDDGGRHGCIAYSCKHGETKKPLIRVSLDNCDLIVEEYVDTYPDVEKVLPESYEKTPVSRMELLRLQKALEAIAKYVPQKTNLVKFAGHRLIAANLELQAQYIVDLDTDIFPGLPLIGFNLKYLKTVVEDALALSDSKGVYGDSSIYLDMHYSEAYRSVCFRHNDCILLIMPLKVLDDDIYNSLPKVIVCADPVTAPKPAPKASRPKKTEPVPPPSNLPELNHGHAQGVFYKECSSCRAPFPGTENATHCLYCADYKKDYGRYPGHHETTFMVGGVVQKDASVDIVLSDPAFPTMEELMARGKTPAALVLDVIDYNANAMTEIAENLGDDDLV